MKVVSHKLVNIKIPQIARWRIAGVTDRKIADLIGMSGSGLAQILATAEYQDYEAALLNGHLSAMDRALAGKVEAIQQECRLAVPAALRCLVDNRDSASRHEGRVCCCEGNPRPRSGSYLANHDRRRASRLLEYQLRLSQRLLRRAMGLLASYVDKKKVN